MKTTYEKIADATTLNDLMERIVDEINLRAWQERTVATIGRTTKLSRAAHEHTAAALDCLATHLKAAL